MRISFLIVGVLLCGVVMGQSVTANLATAKWTHDKGDPPGSESVLLREDAATGAMELLVRYPAGHKFDPHWHSANERILLLEGKMSVKVGDRETVLEPGGYAFLPAKEIQHLACVSASRCTFYVYWDGKLDNHKVN
jgi:quercetin dioxygenase-like cupin family protein